MENSELGNTSTKLDKKNKSKHAVSSDLEIQANADVKPRRSFWRSLFRKQHKKGGDVKELVTDPKAAMLSPRLNAIFEEPKTPEEKEHVDEEIEDIKQTLKRISPVVVEPAPPSVLLSGIAPPTSEVPRDEAIIEYLSDMSSTSSGASDGPEVPSAETELETDSPVSGAAPDSKRAPEPRDSPLGRDGYSFEYSETSDASVEDKDEDKTDKVITFDDKVEQKDADSNIVVRDLNLGEDEEAEDEKTLQEEEEIEMIGLGADREEVVTGSGVVLVLPSAAPITTQEDVEEQDAEELLPTERFLLMDTTLTTSGSSQPLQHNHHLSAPHHHHQTEVWLQPGTGSVAMRNCRLDDVFKMVFQQTSDAQVLNYSVAFDPILANFNVHCCPATTKTMAEEAPYFYAEKQKVVRKRKMMSLLHDKNKMAEYLKEIEKQEENKHVNVCSAPQNSPNTVLQQQQQQQQQMEPETNQKEILYVLENTKKKLQTYLESDSEVLSLYPDIFNNNSDNNDKNDNNESDSDTSVVPTAVDSSSKHFANIGAEIESIFAELLLNVSELKEACIVHGATHDAREPPVTMRPLGAHGAVASLLDELLERVWTTAESDVPPTASLHTSGALPGAQTLQQGVELLEALKDEVCEYRASPAAAAAIADQTTSVEQLVIDLNKIPRNLLPLLAEPEIDGGGGPLDKSKRFAPYYDDRKSLQQRTTSPPEVTESLKHIFFGDEASGHTAIHSEFNLLVDMSPKAGPSRETTADASAPSLPHLPSVPSDSFETLMRQQFSSAQTGTSTSMQDELPLTTVEFFNDDDASGSSASPPTNTNCLQLERKSPETNLHPDAQLSKSDIDRSIEDNMKMFQKSIEKISQTNQKTVEMLTSSSFSTPEGSLSILSTITENMLETMSKTSRSSKTSGERYPQFIPGCEEPQPNTITRSSST